MRARPYLVVGAVGLAVLAAEYRLHYRGLVFPDALDYAQMAREVASGRLFNTLIVRPLTLASGDQDPFLDASRPPLHPLTLGVWFAVLGSGELQAALFSGLFWLGGGLALCALGRGKAPGAPALVAAVLFFLSPKLLPYAWSGMSEMPFILLLILGFHKLSTPPRARSDTLGGALLISAACLWRAIGLLAVPWVVILAWKTHKRTVLFAGLLAPLLGWTLVKQFMGAPSPLSFNLAQFPMFTETYPRYTLFRSVTRVDPIDFMLNNPGELMRKFAFGFKVYLTGALRLLPLPATLAWVLGAVLPRYNRKLLALRNVVLGMLATCLCVLPLYEPTPRFLLPLIPFLLLLGAAWVWGIAPARLRAPLLAVWTIACLVALPRWARAPAHYPDHFSPYERTELSTLVGAEGVVLTDAPWRTAWELGLKSVWIPQDEETLRAVEGALPQLSAFVLTAALGEMDAAERPGFWVSVWDGQTWPRGYERTALEGSSVVIGLRMSGGRRP